MIVRLLLFALPLSACVARADLVDTTFDESAPITQNTWTAGTDLLDTWYTPHAAGGSSGPAFEISGGVANLVHANRNHYRSMLQAISLPEAGEYILTLDTLYDDYSNQLNYWQVFGATNGTVFNLRSQTWSTVPTGATRFVRDYAPNGDEDGVNFVFYEDTFTITDDDVANYDYLVVALTGSRGSGQILQFDNVSVQPVPEPSTLLMLLTASLGLGYCLRRSHRRTDSSCATQTSDTTELGSESC